MKLKQLASFIPAITLVAVVFGTVIVFAPPEDPLLPAYIEVFVVNTDPVPVALDGPIEVTLDEPIEVTVTDGVTLAEDTEVTTKAKTELFIAFNHETLPAASGPMNPGKLNAFIDVDGYKTVNIWTKGINNVETRCEVGWQFTIVSETFYGWSPNIAEVGESQQTHEVRAPTLRILIKNYGLTPSEQITVLVYAVS